MSDTTTPAAVTPGLARLRASPDADAIRSKVIAQSKAALAAAATTKAASPKAKKTTAKKAAPKKASKPAAKPTGAKVKKPEPGGRASRSSPTPGTRARRSRFWSRRRRCERARWCGSR
jgi:hypothetical protein